MHCSIFSTGKNVFPVNTPSAVYKKEYHTNHQISILFKYITERRTGQAAAAEHTWSTGTVSAGCSVFLQKSGEVPWWRRLYAGWILWYISQKNTDELKKRVAQAHAEAVIAPPFAGGRKYGFPRPKTFRRSSYFRVRASISSDITTKRLFVTFGVCNKNFTGLQIDVFCQRLAAFLGAQATGVKQAEQRRSNFIQEALFPPAMQSIGMSG